MGLAAEKIITHAREIIAAKIGADAKNIYFTSGGTEANNMAILGYCRANKKRANRIITTKVEHKSVLSAAEQLEKEGFFVDYVGVDSDGIIDLDELYNCLSPDTLLVSVMMANNEVGTIMPTEKIKELMTEKAPGAILHQDAVQAFGKIPIRAVKSGIDMISISAHKIHGTKGTGALYTAKKHIQPIIFGGGQQGDLRSGTENVPGIAAFAAAAEEADTDNMQIKKSRLKLKEAISKKVENVSFNGSDEYQTGYILNASFKRVKAEILLHMLEDEGIFVSTGSACSSNKPMPSHVLAAMGVSGEDISGAVRLSFSSPLSDCEIEMVSDMIAKAVSEVRKYTR